MKNVIIWAGRHKTIAQVLLTLLLILVAIGGVLFGISVSLDGFQFNSFPFMLVALSLFLPILILYPSKKELRKIGVSRGYFKKWKIYDLSLVLILAFTAFFTGNQATNKSFNDLGGVKVISSLVDLPLTFQVTNLQISRPSLKETIKQKVQIFQSKIISFTKNLKEKTNTGSKALNTLFIILMYISYLIILFYAAIIACGLACDGMGVAASFVLISTQVLLLVGIFFGIRALLKQRMKWMKKPWSKNELNFRIVFATIGAFLSPTVFYLFSGF